MLTCHRKFAFRGTFLTSVTSPMLPMVKQSLHVNTPSLMSSHCFQMKRNSLTPPPCSSVQHGGASPVAACFCSLLTLLLWWWKSVDCVLLLLFRFMAVSSHYRPPLVIFTNCIRTASPIHDTVFHECHPQTKIIWSEIGSWRKYNTGHMWSAPTTFYLLSYSARQDRRWNQTWPKMLTLSIKSV